MKGVYQTIALTGLVIAASLLGQLGMVQAAQFRAGDKVTVEANELIGDDLYVFCDELIVDGTVQGDLVVFARQITVNGLVVGDLVAAGHTVVLNGAVGDDLRMAGEVLKLATNSEVADDVIAAGFSVEAEDDSTVDGGFYYAGCQARFAGSVGKGITATLSNCELSGTVLGDVRLGLDPDENASQTRKFRPQPPVAMPAVPPGLTVASSTVIDGVLSYRSRVKGKIDEGASIAGGVEYAPHIVSATPKAEPTTMDKALTLAREFACLAIIGLCILVIMPRWSQGLAESVRTKPLASLGSGLLGIVFFAVSLILLVVLVVALMFAFSLLTLDEMVPVVLTAGVLTLIGSVAGFWFFASYIAQIMVSLALGRFMLFAGKTQRRILPFLVGLVVVVILLNQHQLTNLPYTGLITNAIVIVLGFGGLILWFVSSRTRRAEE